MHKITFVLSVLNIMATYWKTSLTTELKIFDNDSKYFFHLHFFICFLFQFFSFFFLSFHYYQLIYLFSVFFSFFCIWKFSQPHAWFHKSTRQYFSQNIHSKSHFISPPHIKLINFILQITHTLVSTALTTLISVSLASSF